MIFFLQRLVGGSSGATPERTRAASWSGEYWPLMKMTMIVSDEGEGSS